MNFRDEKKRRGSVVLDITPLVDVVFQLIIFFALTTTYVKNPNLDISLPKASLSQTASQKRDLTIAVKTGGEIRYDNKTISFEQLEGILRAEYSEKQDMIVVINADKDAKHGRVVEVMDLAKTIGFEKLAIAVQARSAAAE